MFADTIRRLPRPADMDGLSTEELRELFLVPKLFTPGKLTGHFTNLDRLAVGGVMPVEKPVELDNHKETGRGVFLERREIGIINVGGEGKIRADDKDYALGNLACAYLPMGTKSVSFMSTEPARPAKFYFLSCPAHAPYPIKTMALGDATPVALGAEKTSNKRTIYKFIHEGGIQSCQLVMGLTALEPGSVWNSFPPHTHWRRSEIYFYFDLGEEVLVHFFGEPQKTRHVLIHNEEAALSPDWSIHCGCGTGNYKFIWGMAGENQRFDDMDAIAPKDLQ